MKSLKNQISEALLAGEKVGYKAKVDKIVEGDAVYVRTTGKTCVLYDNDIQDLIDTAKENNLTKIVFSGSVYMDPTRNALKGMDFGGLTYVFDRDLKLEVTSSKDCVLSNGNFEVKGEMTYVRKGIGDETILKNMNIVCNNLTSGQTLMPKLENSTWKCTSIYIDSGLYQSTVDAMLCNCTISQIEDEEGAQEWAEKRNLLDYDTPLIRVSVGMRDTNDFTKQGKKISVPTVSKANMKMADSWFRSKQYKQFFRANEIY